MGRVTTFVLFGLAATHDIFPVSLRPVSRERPKRTRPGIEPPPAVADQQYTRSTVAEKPEFPFMSNL